MRKAHGTIERFVYLRARRALEWRSQPAIAQSLGYVPPSDIRRAVEIGQSARDAQNPVVPARRETQSLRRPQQQRVATRLGARDLIEQCPIRVGVGSDAPLDRQRGIARRLSSTGCGNATSDRRTPLGGGRQSEIPGGYGGDVDMNIDAVQ